MAWILRWKPLGLGSLRFLGNYHSKALHLSLRIDSEFFLFSWNLIWIFIFLFLHLQIPSTISSKTQRIHNIQTFVTKLRRLRLHKQNRSHSTVNFTKVIVLFLKVYLFTAQTIPNCKNRFSDTRLFSAIVHSWCLGKKICGTIGKLRLFKGRSGRSFIFF